MTNFRVYGNTLHQIPLLLKMCRRLFPVQVQLDEGALILSRNGLNTMGITLELETAYGCGRDTLMALHTLVLSCNQLQVCAIYQPWPVRWGGMGMRLPNIRGLQSVILTRTSPYCTIGLQVLDKSVLTAMPALRHLDVSHNLLCRMEPIDGHDLPARLQTLNMSHNRISRIGGIGQCCSLRMLDLSRNRIKVCLIDLNSNRAETGVSGCDS